MGYARHIGRVGALAVALGIGAAVAGSGGIAWADETGSGATTSGNGQAPGSSAGPAGTDATPAAPRRTVADPPASNPASPKLNQPGLRLPRVIVRSSGGLTNSGPSATPATKPDTTPATKPDTTPAPKPDSKPASDVFGQQPASVPSESAPVEQPATNARQDTPTPWRAQRSTAPVVQTNISAPTAASAMRSRPSLTQITSDFSTSVQRTVSDATAAIGATADAQTTAVTNASTSAASHGLNFSGVPLAATTELTTQPGAPASAPVNPVTQVVSGLLAAIGLNLNVTNSPVPAVPPQTLMGALELIRRETEATLARTMSPPAQPVLTAATTPDPSANVGPATANPVQSPNLLVNPGAEVNFLDANGVTLGTGALQPVTANALDTKTLAVDPLQTTYITALQASAAAVSPTAAATASAATTPSGNVTIEAESMVVSPARARRYSDPTASDGRALVMSGNSSVSITLSLPASTSLVVSAKGDQYKGAPQMVVSIDRKAIARISVSATSWTDYTIPVSIPAGTHTISIAFTNDLYSAPSRDRNLRLDKVTMVAANVTSAFLPIRRLALEADPG